jgi:hypothetical protein
MANHSSMIKRLRARQTSGKPCEACVALLRPSPSLAAANSRFCISHGLSADIKAWDEGREYVRIVEDQRPPSHRK